MFPLMKQNLCYFHHFVSQSSSQVFSLCVLLRRIYYLLLHPERKKKKLYFLIHTSPSMAASSSNSEQQQQKPLLNLAEFSADQNSKRNTPPVPQEHLSVGQSKQWRVDIWNETKAVLEAGKYTPFRGQPNTVVTLPPLDTQMNICTLDSLPCQNSGNKKNSSVNSKPLKITCYRGDCLDAARIAYVKYNGNDQPFVMNAASHRRAGGGYQNGSRAQEEELCRRTSLAFAIDSSHKRQKMNPYPLPNGTGHFENNVSVFREGPKSNYAFLPKPFLARFGAVAAPVQPALTADGQSMLQEGANKMTNSLRLFFRMAVTAGSKVVVPIALGAGAFRCPANHVSKLMMQAIVEECSNTCVEEVLIAIFDDHNAVRKGNEEGNFLPFARAAVSFFGSESVEVVDESGEDLKASVLGGAVSSTSSASQSQSQSKATASNNNNQSRSSKNRLQ